MQATKRFKAEVAHRLTSSYSTRCQSIHGHSYLFELTLEGKDLNCDGMVMDFGEMKEKFNSFLDKFDHCLVMYDKDPMLNIMEDLAQNYSQRFMVVDYNPTAENMAYHIFNVAKDHELPVTKVRVQETLTGWATTTKGLETIKGVLREYNL